jgi:hypothetical protein
LTWGVQTYDFAADWYSYQASRLRLGLTFPESWFDSSIILVGPKDPVPEKSLNLWSWLLPFSWDVWVMMGVTVLVGGISFYLIVVNDPREKKCFPNNANDSLFVAAMAVTKKILHKPYNTPARVVCFAASIWAVIISSAYTANLASALVARNEPSIVINGVDDAVRYGLKICTFAGGSQETELRSAYPQAKIVGQTNAIDLYAGIARGECAVTLTGKSSWDLARYQNDVNPKCELDWIGRTFTDVPAGFTMYADSGTLCTNLLRDVMSLHFREMKSDGFISQAWNELYTRTSTVTCNPEGEDQEETKDEEVPGQMTMLELGGIFILYYAVMFLALLYVYVPFYIKKITGKNNEKEDSGKKEATIKTADEHRPPRMERSLQSMRMSSNMGSFLTEDKMEKVTNIRNAMEPLDELRDEINDINEKVTRIIEILAARNTEM